MLEKRIPPLLLVLIVAAAMWGISTLTSSVPLDWGIFLGPGLGLLYMNRFQIAPEERALRALFGDEFRAYEQRGRRWL